MINNRKLIDKKPILNNFGINKLGEIPKISESIIIENGHLLFLVRNLENYSPVHRYTEGSLFVVYDDKVFGGYDQIRQMFLSKDGKKFAYLARKFKKDIIKTSQPLEGPVNVYDYDMIISNTNKNSGEKYNKIYNFIFNKNSGGYLYVGEKTNATDGNNNHYIVYNGQEFGSYEEVRIDDGQVVCYAPPTLSNDGRKFFYLAYDKLRREGDKYFYLNGKIILKLNENEDLLKATFTKSDEIAYLVRKKYNNNQKISFYKTDGVNIKKIFEREFPQKIKRNNEWFDVKYEPHEFEIFISKDGQKVVYVFLLYSEDERYSEKVVYLNNKEIINSAQYKINLNDNINIIDHTPNYEKIAFLVTKYSIEKIKYEILVVDTIQGKIESYKMKDPDYNVYFGKFLGSNNDFLFAEGTQIAKKQSAIINLNNRPLFDVIKNFADWIAKDEQLDRIEYFRSDSFRCYKNYCFIIFFGVNKLNKQGLYLLVLDFSEKENVNGRLIPISDAFDVILDNFKFDYSINKFNDQVLVNVQYVGLNNEAVSWGVYEISKSVILY